MGLYKFFRTPEHYVARERLLHLAASFEIKLQAAICEAQIQMTEPEIDNNGYDFTLTLRHYHTYVQNKSTMSDSSVKQWDIHPVLLQPSFCDRDISPFVDGAPVGGYGHGASGGVLLHIIDADAAKEDNLKVNYRYFDIFYAGAIASGLWESDVFKPNQAKDILRSVKNGGFGNRISLPIEAFLPVSSPAAIIGLRFHLPSPTNYISLIRPACSKAEAGDDISDIKKLWEMSVQPWVDN